MMAAFLLLLTPAAALRLAPTTTGRREVMLASISRRNVVAAVPVLFACARTASAAQRTPPTDFGLTSETRPFSHYLDNAEKLAYNLDWYANGVDPKVGAALDEQITAFSVMYGQRPGALIDGGPQPGMSQLNTAYDALAYHFSRYGDDTMTPLPEQLTGTILRNVKDAQKQMKRARGAQAGAA